MLQHDMCNMKNSLNIYRHFFLENFQLYEKLLGGAHGKFSFYHLLHLSKTILSIRIMPRSLKIIYTWPQAYFSLLVDQHIESGGAHGIMSS